MSTAEQEVHKILISIVAYNYHKNINQFSKVFRKKKINSATKLGATIGVA